MENGSTLLPGKAVSPELVAAAFGTTPVLFHTGSGSAVAISSGGLTIDLQYDAAAMAAPASFRAGIEQAARIITSAISDRITVNIGIDYSGTGGGAAAGPDNGILTSYSSVRSTLIAHEASGDTTFNGLPVGSSIQGNNRVAVWNAQLKLFGALSPNDTGTDDGSATFATDINSNLLVGVALHELTHAMGRVPFGPQPDIFDLFRWTNPSGRLFSDNSPSAPAYFSFDGVTKLADYGRTSDISDFLNSGVQGGNDTFNEFYNNSTLQQLSTVDLQQMAALGYHLFPTPALFPDLIATSLASLASNTVAYGTPLAVTYSIRNIGGGASSDGSQSTVYLSTDSTVTSADKALVTVTNIALIPGFTTTVNTSAVLTGVAPGTYWIGVIADSNNRIVETNETNNVSNAIQITLLPPRPTVTIALATDNGLSSTDKITSNPALTGKGDANIDVHFTVDGNVIAGIAHSDANGVWSFDPTGLADGAHMIVASETNVTGTGSTALSFTLDTHGPTDWSFALTGSAFDSTRSIAAKTVLGSVTATDATSNGNFRYFFANDAAGNGAAKILHSLSIDPGSGQITTSDIVSASSSTWLVAQDVAGNIFARQLVLTLGGSGADAITLAPGTSAAFGFAGADSLTGTGAAEAISGGGGNDGIIGFAGADSVDGGADSDTIVLTATSTDLNAATNGQIVNVEAVSAAAASTGVAINLQNQSEGFQITGSALNDTLTGGNGNYSITGGGGTDSIVGGNGNDTLVGGGGADLLRGGAGADIFVFTATGDSPTGSRDTVFDFTHSQNDRIDLHLIDAVSGGGDNAFKLVSAFTHVAGQLISVVEADHYVVQGDINGDGLADFAINVFSSTALTSSDFIL